MQNAIDLVYEFPRNGDICSFMTRQTCHSYIAGSRSCRFYVHCSNSIAETRRGLLRIEKIGVNERRNGPQPCQRCDKPVTIPENQIVVVGKGMHLIEGSKGRLRVSVTSAFGPRFAIFVDRFFRSWSQVMIKFPRTEQRGCWVVTILVQSRQVPLLLGGSRVVIHNNHRDHARRIVLAVSLQAPDDRRSRTQIPR